MIKALSSSYPEHFNQSLYTAQQTRDIDRLAIDTLYSGNGYELMKKAGHALFQFLRQQYGDDYHWFIFCGRGNNGGDGYVAAKLACDHGISATVIQMGNIEDLPNALQGEALSAFIDLQRSKISPVSFAEYQTISSSSDQPSLIVDAMLGTGLTGDVRGEYLEAIACINESNCPVVSVDIPSGLSSDTGQILGAAVKADQTLTFIGINQGLVTGQAKAYTGSLYYDELAIPASLKDSIQSSVKLLSPHSFHTELFRRNPTDHKGDSGRGLFIGGSDGTSGAALLACEASLRSGIGLLSAIVGKNAVQPMLTRTPEVMVRGYESDLQNQVNLLAEKSDAMAIGPGLGIEASAKKILETVLTLKKPTLIDADALNLLSKYPELWDAHGHEHCVMTPHPLEAARLLNISVEQVELDRFSACVELTKKYGCTILLKGSGTLISKKQNNVFVSYFGNESMATGGMGDVLSGIILAFLAKSRNCIESTKLAAFVHAMAAEQASNQGIIGCLPTDVSNNIRLVIKETL